MKSSSTLIAVCNFKVFWENRKLEGTLFSFLLLFLLFFVSYIVYIILFSDLLFVIH